VSGALPQRDVVDVRLADAIAAGGCVACTVRDRSERATVDAIIAERVLDLGFRAGLEREHGFCRRHAVELLASDRRAAGILGSSILYGAIVERRVAALREALGHRGRRRRNRLATARARPPCLACGQGASAVEVALARLAERSDDPAWAAVTQAIPFCLDDLGALLAAGADSPTFEPIAAAQLVRLDELQSRLEAYAHNSAQDRRHRLTDAHRSAADEAARALGGDAPQAGPGGRDGPVSR
jgi:bacterioferritin-associated ferredoxin